MHRTRRTILSIITTPATTLPRHTIPWPSTTLRRIVSIAVNFKSHNIPVLLLQFNICCFQACLFLTCNVWNTFFFFFFTWKGNKKTSYLVQFQLQSYCTQLIICIFTILFESQIQRKAHIEFSNVFFCIHSLFKLIVHCLGRICFYEVYKSSDSTFKLRKYNCMIVAKVKEWRARQQSTIDIFLLVVVKLAEEVYTPLTCKVSFYYWCVNVKCACGQNIFPSC